MNEQYLDAILVPLGLLLLLLYHLWLIRRYLLQPTKTVMGVNAINRRIWVKSMMEEPAKTGVLAVQTFRNNIMASTLVASMAIMLSSLIAVLMSRGWGLSATTAEVRGHGVLYGNSSELLLSLKFFSILTCFLAAFLCNVQAIRYYSHGGVLINVPVNKWPGPHVITPDYVAKALNRGSLFWSLGLKAFYFSFPLFMWLFGPIPMFTCCLIIVFLLYFLDASFEWKRGNEDEREREGSLGPIGQC